MSQRTTSHPAPTRTPPGPARWQPGLFLGWVAVGLVAALGLGAVFTPLILLLLPAGAGAVLLARRHGWHREPWGLVAGIGLLVLGLGAYTGWTRVPGCTGPADAQTCVDTGSPWPALLGGAALVVIGWLASRRRAR